MKLNNPQTPTIIPTFIKSLRKAFLSGCDIFSLQNYFMVITPELKSKFYSSFARIMKQTPPGLQKKWDGNIEWKDDRSYPHIQTEIIQALPDGAKAAYVTLLNKLSRGNI